MSIKLLREAARQAVDAEIALQAALDLVLPPEGRNEERWTVFWIREGDHPWSPPTIEAMLTPPRYCYSLHHATEDNLLSIKNAVGADYISASVAAGELRYRVRWATP